MDDKTNCSCEGTTEEPSNDVLPYIGVNTDWIDFERPSYWDMRLWHVIFIFLSAFCSVVVCLCCCIKFRIPRTKQEIEADYIRKKITRKFTKQLKMIRNAEMDEMDLKKALDKIRSEFKTETESIIQPEDGLEQDEQDRFESGSYRKASDIGVDIEELIERRGSGVGTKISKMVGSIKLLKPRSSNNTLQDIP
ncbi:hypothetical protein GE061_013579 [Apolygus lucorum]|uniref:Transmembrane inner ear expressed protein n=1 Tax=Apolygus lucorum TaxID=248454 RepID=A0A8S9XNE1_APOLU|nr:hypothetical protein GE061_013579 [Apolygus lucorum]